MDCAVTVAVPVRNGGPGLGRVLAAVARQRVDRELEILVCDSGSVDGSAALARRHGARVIEIASEEFGHGRTRNLLMQRARGSHVAFLTQDALPADELWLSRLLGGFSLAPDVGLTFGSYRPRADASPMVARELTDWFRSFSPTGEPRVDRRGTDERDLEARSMLGPRGFFSDANGCVERAAWRRAPFRDIAYAEDHALAHDMLLAGFAKVFLPDAAVIHSHDYTDWGWLRRSFDEARALREIYGWREPLLARGALLNLWGRVGADRRWIQSHSGSLTPPQSGRLLARSTLHHLARMTGAALGGRADRLPTALVRQLSHERRTC
jgi:glycosyltransferase involved in cell wall biosynthesis